MKPESRPLAVGAGVTALGLFFLVGAQTIAGETPYAGVGPRAFPTLIGAALTVLGVAFLIAVRRGMTFPEAGGPVERGTMPWILGGLAAATLAMGPLGFPVAALLLFVLTARGFGSRRWGWNVVLGAVLGVVVYYVFSRALGVSLPGGLFERW